MARSRKEKRKKRLWPKIVLLVIVLLLVGGGVYAFSIYSNLNSTVKDIQKNSGSIDLAETNKKIKDASRINILLLGVDERDGDSGRSDTLMIMSLDPSTESAKLISIPRDTRTEIIGHGTTDKINHAYAFGGVDMSIDTVENLFDFDVDYFAEINMEGLSDLVDAVGGVTVTNDLDWYDEGYYQKGYHYEKGEIHLNGPQAMGYVRMRHLDPEGDFGRNARQRQVVQAVLDEGSSIKSINKIDDLLAVLGNNVQTNMDLAAMRSLITNYRSVANNIESYELQGTGTMIDDIYYFQLNDGETEKVHDMIVEEE